MPTSAPEIVSTALLPTGVHPASVQPPGGADHLELEAKRAPAHEHDIRPNAERDDEPQVDAKPPEEVREPGGCGMVREIELLCPGCWRAR